MGPGKIFLYFFHLFLLLIIRFFMMKNESGTGFLSFYRDKEKSCKADGFYGILR